MMIIDYLLIQIHDGSNIWNTIRTFMITYTGTYIKIYDKSSNIKVLI